MLKKKEKKNRQKLDLKCSSWLHLGEHIESRGIKLTDSLEIDHYLLISPGQVIISKYFTLLQTQFTKLVWCSFLTAFKTVLKTFSFFLLV